MGESSITDDKEADGIKEKLIYGLSPNSKAKFIKASTFALGVVKGEAPLVVGAKKVLGAEVGVIKGILSKVADNSDVNKEIGLRSYELGEYGKIYFFRHRGRTKITSDGVGIKPGDIVGDINLIKNTDNFIDLGSISASRRLYVDFLSAMINLAEDIKTSDFPPEIKAVKGISHLAGKKISEKLGFDIDNAPFFGRIGAALYGASRSVDYEESERFWQVLPKKWKRVHVVWMSTEQVVRSQALFQKLLGRELRTKMS